MLTQRKIKQKNKSTFNKNYSQHELIHLIEEDYNNRRIPKSYCLFKDDTWPLSNSDDSKINLIFDDYMIDENINIGQPEYIWIRLFLKIHTYHLLTKKNTLTNDIYSSTTIKGIFTRARKFISKALIENEVLCLNSDKIRSASKLPPFVIQALIDTIILDFRNSETAKSVISDISHYLNDNPDIPHFFKVPYNPFFYRTPSSLVPNTNTDDNNGYEIIPDSDYFWIGKSAYEFISNYSEDIINIHKITADVYATKLPNGILDCKNQTEKSIQQRITKWRTKLIAKTIIDKGISLPYFSEDHINSWNVTNVLIDRSLKSKKLRRDGFTLFYLYDLFKLLYGACATLIFLPTGIRMSEFLNLNTDRLSTNPNVDGIYIYGNGIKKIRSRSTWFRKNEIPIPVETYHAIHTLEKLTKPLRKDNAQKIVTNIMSMGSIREFEREDKLGEIIEFDSSKISPMTINTYIGVFCNFIRSETVPTSHQFRKTLANYFLMKTKKAPILLMHLFGHKSISMTMRYLKKSHIIRQEIKTRIHEKFSATAKIIAASIMSNNIAGEGGEQIKNAIEARKEDFKGLTESEMKRSIEEWLLEKILTEQFLITHTPTNLCIRPRKARDCPACHCNNCGFIDPELPEPSGCIGGNCKWALYTYNQVDALDNNLVYYKHIIETVDSSLVENQYMLKIAHELVETYDSLTKRIKRIPINQVKNLIVQ